MYRLRLSFLAIMAVCSLSMAASSALAGNTTDLVATPKRPVDCKFTRYVPVGPRHFVRVVSQKKVGDTTYRTTLYIRHMHRRIFRWRIHHGTCGKPRQGMRYVVAPTSRVQRILQRFQKTTRVSANNGCSKGQLQGSDGACHPPGKDGCPQGYSKESDGVCRHYTVTITNIAPGPQCPKDHDNFSYTCTGTNQPIQTSSTAGGTAAPFESNAMAGA